MSDQKKLIAVVGATGAQGGSVLKYLVESGRYKVRALTRNVFSAKAMALKKYGNDVVLWKCDTRESDQVIEAFEGCWGAFLLTDFWSDPEKMVKDEVKYGRILIDAAVKTNLKFAIFSSLPNVEILSEGRLQVPHFTSKNIVEEYARNEFRDSNIVTKFGFVYPGFYIQNFLHLPGVGMKLNQDGVLVNDLLPIKEDTKIPMINIEEFGKWTLPMFDQCERFANSVVYASNDYITMPQFMDILSKKLNTTYIYKTCSYDDYYKISENNEMVHMFRFFNEIGYYAGAQLGDFRSWTKDVMLLEDAIRSLDWSALRPSVTQKITEKLGAVKETVLGAFSSGERKTDTSQSAE